MVAVIGKKCAAKFLFQGGDALPQGLPGQIEPGSGMRIIEVLTESQKITELLNGHGGIPLYKSRFYLRL